MAEFNEYQKFIYGIPEPEAQEPEVETQVVDEVPVATETITEPTVEATTSQVQEESVTAPFTQEIETPVVEPAPYKSKKFIEVEDEAALFAKLNAKYGHTAMKPEEKAIAYLREQNPELDEKEIAFLAESDYGIGLERPDIEELTTEQIAALNRQDIARKKLTSQADKHFASKAEQVALEDYDPLDLDPDYKEYRTSRQAEQAERTAREQHIADVTAQIETNAKTISEIAENFEIDLDESKLAFPVSFKLDANKQKQLEDFAKRYTPSQEEYDQFNDPKTGKFDYKGYLQHIAPVAFAKDIVKASIKQALAQDRQRFVEKELKNSTLRNNDVTDTQVRKVDPHDYYWDRYGGK